MAIKLYIDLRLWSLSSNAISILCVVLGLKKFLASYPALFYISGDYVHVNTFQIADDCDPNGVCGSAGGKRDYIQEAKDYFKHKLLMYGLGTEVPIRSLMGHRSQASPQVRHISGQHFKEFTEFLAKHTDYFTVVDDHVILVDSGDLQNVPASERLHLPQASIDTKATQQLLDFFAQCIESKGGLKQGHLCVICRRNGVSNYD